MQDNPDLLTWSISVEVYRLISLIDAGSLQRKQFETLHVKD